MADMTDAEKIEAALRRAYSLGQTYWQQADSDSYKQNKKSDETAAKFITLLAETRAIAARLQRDNYVNDLHDTLDQIAAALGVAGRDADALIAAARLQTQEPPPLPELPRTFVCAKCGHYEPTTAALSAEVKMYPACAKCGYLGFVVSNSGYSPDQMHAYWRTGRPVEGETDAQWRMVLCELVSARNELQVAQKAWVARQPSAEMRGLMGVSCPPTREPPDPAQDKAARRLEAAWIAAEATAPRPKSEGNGDV